MVITNLTNNRKKSNLMSFLRQIYILNFIKKDTRLITNIKIFRTINHWLQNANYTHAPNNTTINKKVTLQKDLFSPR